MTDKPFGDIYPIDIEDEMKRSYMDYAMSTIISRALPDVRDGMKPVHRRCMFAMFDMGLLHNRAYVKSARVVGDVMGKYHPHSDAAIYDTIVRLAQDFRMRYTIIDGQGNFGSVDGDMAAAMRYTEVRMRELGEELLADIDKNTVDFVPNYDNSLSEPEVLPSRFPNFLVNGNSGIAVGMATNVPPHNLGEVCDALVYLVDNPKATTAELMQFIPGPDFPTGGLILGTSGIKEAYETGRGTITMRARAYVEPSTKSGKDAIIINEIPYQVNKSTLIQQIADLVKDKRIESIADLRDESDRQGMRIYIELKRGENAQVTLNKLFKLTRMSENFGVIMLGLVGQKPVEMKLKQVLAEFIEHRRQVIIRRTIFDLEKAREKAHILQGLKIAIENIDTVVEIIRKSRTVQEASEKLQSKLDLSERQAKAILDMRLARLTGLERDKIVSDLEDTLRLIKYLEEILDDERKVLALIKEDLAYIKEKYGDPRRTQIVPNAEEMNEEDFFVDEEVVVSVTHRGYIKRTPASIYRSQRRGGRGINAMSTRDEDFVESLFTATNHDIILIFTTQGKVYSLRVFEIPEFSRIARGLAIANLININSGDCIASCCRIREFDENKDIFFCTKQGRVKRTNLADFSNARKNGVIAIGINDGDELMGVRSVEKADENIVLITKQGKSIRFELGEVRTMGRSAAGVNGISLQGDDEVVGMLNVTEENQDMLTITENGYGKRTPIEEYRLQHRAGMGIIGHKVSKKTGNVVGALIVEPGDEIIVIASDGILIRTRVDEISSYGRSTQGVRIMRVRGDGKVSGIARVVESDEESSEPEETTLDI
jgi:DNA gyrase subunit A